MRVRGDDRGVRPVCALVAGSDRLVSTGRDDVAGAANAGKWCRPVSPNWERTKSPKPLARWS